MALGIVAKDVLGLMILLCLLAKRNNITKMYLLHKDIPFVCKGPVRADRP